MGDGNACDVCGGSETKLVDGYYYCAECGTQDTNVRETIVEHTALADGTFAYFTKAKYSVKIKDGEKMSPEWYKWHAYNFVLAGLTERMLALGAAPSFKMKVLWIWAKYIKMHQNKKLMGLTDAVCELKEKNTDTRDKEENLEEDDEDDKPPSLMTLRTLVGILYLALNLDKSTIQLSHFRRYMKDGRLHIHRSLDYIPKEIDRNLRELRGLCYNSNMKFTPTALPSTMSKFGNLDLGSHLIPDLGGILDNLLKELCLPKVLKNLVWSLIDFAPINFLDKKKNSQTIPDAESVVMSYILVALKMCFGLDDEYEIMLSDAVDEINHEENNLKAYKTDLYSEPSERLFSFREWYKYMLFRKQMLCKHYLPIAKECNLFLDDYVYVDHSKSKAKKVVKLSDEVTMDIIKKIPEYNDVSTIPLTEFEVSATPLSTHTEVITRNLRDPDTRQLLSEDFTQYSINYACQDLSLPSCSAEISRKIVVGVKKTGKIKNEFIGLHLMSSTSDSTMVYVKKCENKNWFKTKRPTAEHIVKEDSDHGYDSNIENSQAILNSNSNIIQLEPIQDAENTCDSVDKEEIGDKKLEVFEEEEEGKNIFDDDFLHADTEDTKLGDSIQNFGNNFSETMDTLRYEDSYHEGINELEDSKVDIQGASLIDIEIDATPKFDPATFNKEETIKELMIAACNKYKVPLPQKFKPGQPIKRKADPNVESDASKPKRAKCDEESKRMKGERKDQITEIVSAYYRSLERDVLHQVSREVRSFVENIAQNDRNLSFDQNSFSENDNNNATDVNDPIDTGIGDVNVRDLDRNLDNNSDQLGTEENENNLDQNEIDGEKSDDVSILDPIYKGKPNFDEKTHDTKQLYLKARSELESRHILDSENDEEINALIEEKLRQSNKFVTDTIESDFDPSDDIPLSYVKKRKQRKNYDNLIENPENLTKFNYWFKHYISQFFKKSNGFAKKFDADMKESFPRSFVFVLTECAFILNCTTYTLYRHLTDIEEKMLMKDGFKKKMRRFKDIGVVLERRDYQSRKDRIIEKMWQQTSQANESQQSE
ncbi:hypothetical protein MSG28_014080 [Choristoneura fumiferana]|uniref:Uncharacterized protein n=1 Tax=Choristoneura fumiferana TaxID=7141 RepID=A0ACC0JFZ2_CHOFU|nr:hypothetical protein MSG28_014080 [Choristoneura fumiferana]